MVEWKLFYEHEPWGYFAEEFRAGLVASIVVNCTPRSRGAKMFRRDEWCRDPWKDDPGDFTPEQQAFLEKRRAEKAKGKKHGKRR